MPIDKAGRFTYQKQYSRWDIMQAQRSVPMPQASQKYLNSGQDALSRAAERLFQPDHRARATSPPRSR